jgi:CRP/FNR family transcriptional regulator
MSLDKSFHNCANCPSRHTTEWRALSKSELELVDQAKRTRVFEPGVALYHQGDQGAGIYCIQSGLVGLRRVDENGNSALLRMCAAGTTIGYRALLSKEDHRNTAEVLIPSVVCLIERSLVTWLLATSPQLGERFLQHAIEDLNETEDNYAKSLTLSQKSRFLHVMLVFYERLGHQDETGIPVFELPVQRNDLASLIGIRPESISRMINKVQSEGLLRFDNRLVMFTDMDSVLREAGAAL